MLALAAAQGNVKGEQLTTFPIGGLSPELALHVGPYHLV